jgi:phosphate uptake regulator
MTKLEMLLQAQQKAAENLKSLEERRRQQLVKLGGNIPSLDFGRHMAAMESQIKILTGKLTEAQAATQKEQARLEGPEAKKASKDAAKLKADITASRVKIIELIDEAARQVLAMRADAGHLEELQRVAGEESDHVQVYRKWHDGMRQMLSRVKDLDTATPRPK